jgi:hypothetical protein
MTLEHVQALLRRRRLPLNDVPNMTSTQSQREYVCRKLRKRTLNGKIAISLFKTKRDVTKFFHVQFDNRSTRTTKKVKDFNWANVLSTDPEKIFRAAASLSQQAIGGKLGVNGRKQQSPIANPTPAMLQILSKKKENMRSPIRGKIPPLAEVR